MRLLGWGFVAIAVLGAVWMAAPGPVAADYPWWADASPGVASVPMDFTYYTSWSNQTGVNLGGGAGKRTYIGAAQFGTDVLVFDSG